MKRTVSILALCLTLLAGCTPVPEPSPEAETPAVITSNCFTNAPDLSQDEEPTWVSCRIIDGAEDGNLLLAELDYPLNDHGQNLHDGKSVYRLSLNGFRCEEESQPDGSILAVTIDRKSVV